MEPYEELPPNYKKSLMKRTSELSPFWSLLGMEILDIKKGWAKIRLPFSEKLTNPLGIAHGGAVFSPADSAIGLALMGMVEKGEVVITVEMKINYIQPFSKGEIIAEAKIDHKGSHVAVGEVDVKNEQGELVAKGVATYMILKKK